MNRKKNTVWYLLLALSLLMGLCGYPAAAYATTSHAQVTINHNSVSATGTGTAAADTAKVDTAKEEQPTWTFLFYLCGTDLEPSNKMGTNTLNQLTSAAPSSQINLVVQTGGSKSWNDPDIDKDKAMRLEIKDGRKKVVWSKKKQNMGNKSTLSNFLKWGKKNYPADHTVLVVVDHGLGPVKGVICDVQFKDDSLMLPEMSEAFRTADAHFDMVVFDTCITANLETASVLAPWADYMIASEETSSPRGNDYKNTLNDLGKNPSMSPLKLSKKLVDRTKKMLATKVDENYFTEDSSLYTQSVTRLSKVKAVKTAFENYAKKLLSLQKGTKKEKLYTAIDKVKCYFMPEVAKYRTEYLDLWDLADKTKSLTPKTSTKLKKAINDAVVYNKHGEYQKGSHGLFIYLPGVNNSKANVKNYVKRASLNKAYSEFVTQYKAK